ncbi:hypothetical protein B0H19DRAFT_1236000 [Mycena capillaripes]|nr:hypothetical protein B0H19DRAFT_1236000 [Mycena capillaripes]
MHHGHVLNLNYDVLLHIFTFLNVAALTRCNRVLKAPLSSFASILAQSKYVWLSLVSDLGRRLFLDLRPRHALLKYSTSDLIDEVKRVVRGPQTWPADPLRSPSIRHGIHIPMASELPRPCEPCLLLGGKHLLVQRGSSGCELWEVATRRQIWARSNITRKEVATNLLHSTNEILIGLTVSRGPLSFEVLKLELDSNSVKQNISINLPSSFTELMNPVIDDHFFAADVGGWTQTIGWRAGILLVDLRNHRFVILRGEYVHKPLASLALATRMDFVERIGRRTLQLVEYPELPGRRTPLMEVHECVLHENSYIISTYTAGTCTLKSEDPRSGRHSYFRYRLTFSSSSISSSVTPWIWQRISSAVPVGSNCTFFQSLTFAGYGLSRDPIRDQRKAPRVRNTMFSPGCESSGRLDGWMTRRGEESENSPIENKEEFSVHDSRAADGEAEPPSFDNEIQPSSRIFRLVMNVQMALMVFLVFSWLYNYIMHEK